MAEQRLDRAQVTKAVEALLKYVRAQAGEKKALLGESDVVSLVVALQKVPETGRNKPFPMQVSVAPPRPRAMRAALAASQRAGRSVRALVASHGSAFPPQQYLSCTGCSPLPVHAHLCSRIPHALIRTDEGADICLIVKDSKEMKAALEKKPVPGVSKVRPRLQRAPQAAPSCRCSSFDGSTCLMSVACCLPLR